MFGHCSCQVGRKPLNIHQSKESEFSLPQDGSAGHWGTYYWIPLGGPQSRFSSKNLWPKSTVPSDWNLRHTSIPQHTYIFVMASHNDRDVSGKWCTKIAMWVGKTMINQWILGHTPSVHRSKRCLWPPACSSFTATRHSCRHLSQARPGFTAEKTRQGGGAIWQQMIAFWG